MQWNRGKKVHLQMIFCSSSTLRFVVLGFLQVPLQILVVVFRLSRELSQPLIQSFFVYETSSRLELLLMARIHCVAKQLETKTKSNV